MATMSFTISSDMLDDETRLEDLGIVWYDEENSEYVLVETEYDNNKLTVSTNHFSKWMIVKKSKFLIKSGGGSRLKPNKIYQAVDKSMPWHEAKEYCESLGGYLATISTAYEEDKVETAVSKGEKSFYWIGATDEQTEGIWKWINGENLSYTKWGWGQPDNFSTIDKCEQDYACIKKSSLTWDDLQNDADPSSTTALKNSGFVCEWNSILDYSRKAIRESISDDYLNTSMSTYEAQTIVNEISNYIKSAFPPIVDENGRLITSKNKVNSVTKAYFDEHIWPYQKEYLEINKTFGPVQYNCYDAWLKEVYGMNGLERFWNTTNIYVDFVFNEITNPEGLKAVLNHSIKRKWADEITLTGTTVGIVLSFSGVDFICDLSDITYDITHFELKWSWMGETAIDLVGLLPLIGSLKNIDGIKNIDEITDLIKKTGSLQEIGKTIDEQEALVKYIDEIVETIKDTDEFKTLAKDTELWARVASQNNASDVVVLGKYIEGSADSYEALAKINGYACFSMNDDLWRALQSVLGDDMWSINEKYLDIRCAMNNTFVFSVEPAKYFNDGSSLSKEIDYVMKYYNIENVNDFVQDSDGFWKVIK